MDTLTSTPGPEVFRDVRRLELLPPESMLEMSTQPLRDFQRQRGIADFGLKSITLRRAYIFLGTAALTLGGCYEMYEVLQVGGITTLEAMVLVLFVLLFAWVAFSFMSSLAGRCGQPDDRRHHRSAAVSRNARLRCWISPRATGDGARATSSIWQFCRRAASTGCRGFTC